MTKEEIKTVLEKNNVEFISLQFTDIFGMPKCVTVPSQQFEQVLSKGRMFDGSSIEGFARIEESDMLLVPDLDTFCVLPFTTEPAKMARIICNIYTPDGKPSMVDPRYALKRVLEKAHSMGYEIQIGPELEFFLFNFDENNKPVLSTTDSCGYFEVAPVDYGADCRNEISLALKKMGFTVEALHHEAGQAQQEIDFKYCEALEAADKIVTLKHVTKSIARKYNLYATFMPKPIFGSAGSGMHINISLSKNGKNIMWGNGEANLSETALNFLAGIMKHARGFAAITNPLVNSYKRLVSGYEAPSNIAWTPKSRSPLVRIPAFEPSNARIELRNPDPSCNPYLAFAAVIAAGLDGIENNLKAPAMSKSIGHLPEDLIGALTALEKDTCIKDAMGSTIKNIYVNSKKAEWTSYKMMVTSWELEQYLTKY